MIEPKKRKYKVYTLKNFTQIPQIKSILSQEQINAIEVVGNVLPFKVNNYVVEELIDWNNIPNDPIYQLTFPQKNMLSKSHFEEMQNALTNNYSKPEIKLIANKIRYELNPHPAGQKSNVPILDDQKLTGIQQLNIEFINTLKGFKFLKYKNMDIQIFQIYF